MAFFAVGAPAFASVALYNDVYSWEPAVGTWAETTQFGQNLFGIENFTTTDNVVVTTEAEVRQVPSSWTTWSNGYTGQVLNNGSHSETFSLGSAVTAFGVFVEPAQYVTNSVTLTLSDGSTFSQNVAGYAGAAFFGWVGTGITGFTISSTDQFGVGDVFSVASRAVVDTGTPEPATWGLMLLGLGGVGAMLRRRRLVAA